MLVTVSGPDGSGKSTVVDLLERHFETLGEKPVVLWARLGYTPGFERLKALARRLLGKKIPQQGETERREQVMRQGAVQGLWLAVAVLDLLITYGIRARLLTLQGKTVICDRYMWDALIDRQMYYPDSDWADTLARTGLRLTGRSPDLSFLLLVPFEVALLRSERKNEPFPDTPELREARHRAYERLASQEALRVLDATQKPDALVSEIVSLLPKP